MVRYYLLRPATTTYYYSLLPQDVLAEGEVLRARKWVAVTSATEVHVGSGELSVGSTMGVAPLFAENLAGVQNDFGAYRASQVWCSWPWLRGPKWGGLCT